MRKFSSYGPVDTDLHYYASRENLVKTTCNRLIGDTPQKGGHYITIWAPRQTGKSWTLLQAMNRLKKNERFDVLKIELEHLKGEEDPIEAIKSIGNTILRRLNKEPISITNLDHFQQIFSGTILTKPLILILDEFDALSKETIGLVVGIFRNIYTSRLNEPNLPTQEKDYLLHGLALIGVRRVLGLGNRRGSPFNIQKSIHVPNLTFEEVKGMFDQYQKESGQHIDDDVIRRLFDEAQGQPGLISWFGELMTEGMDDLVVDTAKPITQTEFDEVYAYASYALPSVNILNIISKANEEPHKNFVLDLFKTDRKIEFKYDDPTINYLYMNGVIDRVKINNQFFLKFVNPFVQKRLFNHFSSRIAQNLKQLILDPFDDLSDTITDTHLNTRNLINRFQLYLTKNRDWAIKHAPRRTDMQVYEAVFHFNLFSYLVDFLRDNDGEVYPEFPTGNGQIDLVIKYSGKLYGLELKSFKDLLSYKKAIRQAARYGKQLTLKEVDLVFFVESITDQNRQKLETSIVDENTGISIKPIFVTTGN